MKKLYCFTFLFSLLLLSCNSEATDEILTEKYVSIRLEIPQTFLTKVIDEDNLASEQLINNLSLFFTEPSSLTVTDSYIYPGFSTSGEYKLVTLPVEPATLLTKDIYVVANYNDQANLEAITSISNLQELRTPEVNKTNNLDPLNGFCMFGLLTNFDFTSGTDEIATVPLERTCAKIRVNLSFPDDPTLSTNNSFLIQQVPMYTFVMENPSSILPLTDYFNFAAPIALVDNGNLVYTNNAYIYQSSNIPVITFYTHFNGGTEQQEFTANLPLPDRNYLYDLDVRIFEDAESTTRSHSSRNNYRFECVIKVYNDSGELIETI